MHNQNQKQQIEVRHYPDGTNHHVSTQFEVVEVIRRVPWLAQIGNFNPMFCVYKGQDTLVHSDSGDLSDPFRRTEDYLNTLFIEV